MNLILQRNTYRADGIFSTLTAWEGPFTADTLEHAYDDGTGGYGPKVHPDVYTCVRGLHRLHNMAEDFETFEISGVVGHTDILFHWGNYNRDSEGCVLVGKSLSMQGDGTQMITSSRVAFAELMALQEGVDSFQLTVLP